MKKGNLEKRALITDSPKKALITGVTGQDGSYLAELLLEKDYKVYGMYRRNSTDSFERINHIKDKINLVDGDITDLASIIQILKDVEPNELYNLAAQSFVKQSWTQPIATREISGLGVMKILEAIRLINPKIKFYQASSSEMFGKAREIPQKENTPFYPRSPYGICKAFGHWCCVNYRESYNIFASSGILFNHESERRGKQFVTRKISHSVAKIKLGLQDYLELGNLDVKRDWGHAKDYVEAMWLMLQQNKANDYVIGTGETHSVKEFAEEAFKVAEMPILWEGEELNEVGKSNGKIVVKINPKFKRPAEVDLLIADNSKAKRELNWRPKVKFKELVKLMVESDIKHIGKYGLLESYK